MMHVTKHFHHIKIQLEAITSATNNFSEDNCIGKGGFGEVYKGELIHSERQTVVAVKRLNRAFGQGDPEFWKEIIMLSRYKHENIVSLLGFCDESGEKILVYEYASKKSLDLYLNSEDLTWIQRLKICIGAARGLAYLHNPGGTQQRVLHRDIKSSNILLDENWNARISDLGLSKFGPANQQITFLVSNAVGTIGYCDPVYVETGVLTKESDVYSFGVMLFEVLCGRNIKDEIKPRSLKAFTAIAYQCLKRDLEERPLMTKVVRILERALQHQQEQSQRQRMAEEERSLAEEERWRAAEERWRAAEERRLAAEEERQRVEAERRRQREEQQDRRLQDIAALVRQFSQSQHWPPLPPY
ncbi:receptor-like protein kinase HERK 1 [Cynara cardunculus var. scolymus]|uniref:receptor-like protein kinase HERK 1 n=1 Tax=Cynara cardunculus var. scolymus TaxID=59895 RepID=UPI000D626B80|nr:receptor-like protein kinase HERK 1 [Cynara cardunculus var. scolymus]